MLSFDTLGSLIRCDFIRSNVIRSDIIRYDVIRADVIRSDVICWKHYTLGSFFAF